MSLADLRDLVGLTLGATGGTALVALLTYPYGAAAVALGVFSWGVALWCVANVLGDHASLRWSAERAREASEAEIERRFMGGEP